MFKTKRQKGRIRKLVIIMFAWFMASFLIGPINSAFAEAQAKVDGKCPGTTVEVAGLSMETPCLENVGLKQCPGTEVYYPEVGTGDTCPSAGAADKSGESVTAQEALQKFMALILSVEQMLNKLLWPILFLIGGLLDNNILFGSGMEDRLYAIWVPVRNIVNIIFVITLVGLALYSVLGINSENSQFSIKTMLPKLIAGIIAVNFSFIAIKVFLDVVNVFTTSIFAIPSQIMEVDSPVLGVDTSTDGPIVAADPAEQRKINAFCKQVYSLLVDKSGNIKDFDKSIKDAALIQLGRDYGIFANKPKDIEALATLKFSGTDNQGKWDADLEKIQKLALCTLNPSENDTLELTEAGNDFFRQYGSRNAALAMAINMGEIMFYKEMSAGSMGSGTFESLAVNVIFSVLLYVVYAISFVVLFIVLLARLVVLWLGLALSPLIALSMVIPVAKEKFKLGELTDKFVAHAIAPITIALVMTIGWVMLNAIKSTMTATGSVMGSEGVLIPALPIPGLETLQGLLVSLATVAVVWIGVFMAADGTIASTITSGIKSQAQKFGSFLATAPIKYTPWVPVETKEGSEKVTLDALGNILHQAEYKLQDKGRKEANKIFGFENPIGSVADLHQGISSDALIDTLKGDAAVKDLTKPENAKKFNDAARGLIEELKKSKLKEDNDLGDALQARINRPNSLGEENENKRLQKLAEKAAEARKKKAAEPATPAGEAAKPGEAAGQPKPPTKVEDAVKDKGFNEYLVATGKKKATEVDLNDQGKKAELEIALTAYQAVHAVAIEDKVGVATAWKGKLGVMKTKLEAQGIKDGAKAKSILDAEIDRLLPGDENKDKREKRKTDSAKWLEENWKNPEAPPAEDEPAD